jgi:hypothetical protein
LNYEKKIIIVVLLAVVFFAQNSFAQELYTPRNIKEAYSNGSRSKDGKQQDQSSCEYLSGL